MNENPEGAPNPLNPAPEAAAPAPAPEAPAETAPVAPEPLAPAEPVATEPAATPVAAAPATTTPVAAPKKKKTGMIIGIILGVIALGCGVAALLFFFVFNKSGDQVNDAVIRLLNGDERNIAISGSSEASLMGMNFNVAYTAQMDSTAKAGVITANITGMGSENGIDVEARLTGSDTVYIKFDGLENLGQSSDPGLVTDCASDDTDCASATTLLNSNSTLGSSDSSLYSSLGSLDSLAMLDGQWIKLGLSNLTSFITLPGGLSIDDFSGHKSELVELYKKYPFITSSTNDLKIQKKSNTLYKLSLDYDKMASFANEAIENNCTDGNYCGVKPYTASDMEKMVKTTGEIYAEVDGNNNFTRFYFEDESSNKQDITISYPANVNVSAPDDYVDGSTLTSLFSLFGGSGSYSYGGGSSDWSNLFDTDDIDYSDLLNSLGGDDTDYSDLLNSLSTDDVDYSELLKNLDIDDLDWSWDDEEE